MMPRKLRSNEIKCMNQDDELCGVRNKDELCPFYDIRSCFRYRNPWGYERKNYPFKPRKGGGKQ